VPDRPLVEHWDGREWSVAHLPSLPGNVVLDGVTATAAGGVWAVGESHTPDGGGQPLIVHHAPGRGWSVQALPALPGGSNWASLYGVALANDSVWAADTYVDPVTDGNHPLVLREENGKWAIATVPSPGSDSNLPAALTSIGGHLWMAGVYEDGGSRLPLIESR
jgi:hypothetical protein